MVRQPDRPVSSGRERLRAGPFRRAAFRSALHSPRLGAWLGVALGVTFGVCFVTGLYSHFLQSPPSWLSWPSRPAQLYRVTQGLHVASGIASIPLLLAKLWVVYPHLWTWPPVRGSAHLVERISLFPLVAGGIFLLVSGVINITTWYPWGFFFPAAHYWSAWITIGALVVHVGAKATATRAAFRRGGEEAAPPEDAGLNRRGFLKTMAAAVGGITLTTVGQTLFPARRFAVLAPRRPTVGPQGFPVNKSARGAHVVEAANDPGYRLRIEGRVRTPLSLSIDDLRALDLREATLPIACVDGWSAAARWRGVSVPRLLEMAGAEPGRRVLVESLQPAGLYRTSILDPPHAEDPDTLLALDLDGEPLHIDHGFPVRLIAPNRPGVMQTKWVSRLVVR